MNGMAGNEDVDMFLDDDFPDIPDDELQKLEQDAISFTQQELQSKSWQHVSTVQEAPSAPTRNAVSSKTSRPKRLQGNNTNNLVFSQSALEHSRPDSSDGTIFDEDGFLVIPGERPRPLLQRPRDETAQREQWRLNRFGHSSIQISDKSLIPQASVRNDSHKPEQNQRRSHIGAPNGGSINKNVDYGRTDQGPEDASLRARIAELMGERDELTARLLKASEEISTRHGEVANIRANHLNDERIHQKQLAALHKLKQEESEKHAAALQAIQAENGKSASEIQFLKQELKEEARRAQAYQRQLKERPLTDKPTNVNTTPKRNRSLRDGFDDDEIMAISPVKSGRRSKQGTPTANRKRKQLTASETHVQPLTLRLSGKDPQAESRDGVSESKVERIISIVQKDHETSRHLRLIQSVTNFRPGGGQEILVECLFKYSFPSEPKKNFGTTATDAMAKLEGDRLPGDLVQIFVNLWSRAMKEEYYVCLKLLIEIIAYVLEQALFAIDKTLLSNFLPILESTITINATARFKLMQKDYLNNQIKQKPKINPDINVTACLDLLYTIACLSSDDGDLIDLFWRTLSTDLVLMMLNGCQPIPDITLMLKILATSILPNTFGNICEATQQERFEAYTCDRICYLLLPKPESEKPPYSLKQLCLLRQESLDLLAQLTLGSSSNPFNPASASNYGTKFIANHPNVIARLVRCIYDELAAAYLVTSTQQLHVRLVNSAVQILHFVLFSPTGRQVSWQTKINAINGSGHKFRVAMARLAYAEGTEPGIDAGITEETARMATEILEESVTPDEVEDLVKVFEGDGTSTSRRTSAMGSTQR